MPWSIESNHSECPDSEPWAVVKDGTGEVEGCHETEADAVAHLAALNASEDDDNENITMRTFPARVGRQTDTGNRQAALPDMPDDAEPFTFSAEISSDRLDSYFSRMHETTLRNFAEGARAGVSLLDSHDARKLGYGQSFSGVFEIDGDVSRVVTDFYTLPGVQFGGQHSFASTDDFIRAIQGRMVKDVSVGFYGGAELCDMCGEEVWGWFSDCTHFPGVEYPVGEQGLETILATSTIYNARLSEVSVVYDGATPEAMILKAQRMMEGGRLPDLVARQLQTRYRMRLPKPQRVWAGAKLEKSVTDDQVDEQDVGAMDFEKLVEQIRGVLSEAVLPAEAADDPIEAVRCLIAEQGRLAELADENERLKPLADDGKQYRSDLISEALAEGVRAQGETFGEETYRSLLEGAPIETIKRMRDDWRALGDQRFPGGRQSIDEPEPPVKPNGRAEESDVPNEAYAV